MTIGEDVYRHATPEAASRMDDEAVATLTGDVEEHDGLRLARQGHLGDTGAITVIQREKKAYRS
jgi:hypothetical protein